MKISWWKKALSYFGDIELELTSSSKNKLLEVRLRKGQIMLLAENAIYSFGNLYYNFSKSFEKLNYKNKSNTEILILGLGTGSIPYMLEKKFNIKGNITAVEWDDKVIELFERWTKETLHNFINCIHADAYEYMKNNTMHFDLICMDIFVDQKVPKIFESDAFVQFLNLALKSNGILLYNRLAESNYDIDINKKFEEKIFKKTFPVYDIFKLNTNWMFMSQKK